MLLLLRPVVALVRLRTVLLATVVVITVAQLGALGLLRVAPESLLSHVVLRIGLPAVVVWTPMQMHW